MHFVVIGKDKADGQARKERRADHLEFVAGAQDGIVYAGPLLDEGRMIGSLFVFDLPSRDALDAHLARDPYFAPGMFETVEIYESRWMAPEREKGFLAEEARKMRAADA
ncbi:YciI family protein [Sphingosinicella rhizophila]|uniref:YciI family protein n=1 Tax=Sphingosinicella rhizophila TaxID=3050082 RepID=A0ABU3QA38_9SPHN|nr:YciI family protein [Sphingosinicella sp. GR2756]MDT9600273.1 YciI family protein [Sphingosinicella sp. GR2756]